MSSMVLTYLFVPAHEPKKVDKAMVAGSQAVILDLEDSVPSQEKGTAREGVRRLLNMESVPAGVEVWVRVNGGGSPYFEDDVRAVDWARVAGAVLPKAEEAASVQVLERAGARRLILLIESVLGLSKLSTLAASSTGVERVAPGTWDLALDLGLLAEDDPDGSELIWQIRGQIVLESRRLGLKPPIDGIYARFDDEGGLRTVCKRALRMGYGGKLLIHPRQIPVAKAVFSPDAEALQFAREVVRAHEEAVRHGRGAVQVRGRVIDRPMVERARALLERWQGE